MSQLGEQASLTLEKTHLSPLVPPLARLWRGPLILTGASRVLMVPWYLFCAVSATDATREFFDGRRYYPPQHVLDQLILTGSLWWFFLFSILLAWMFFARRKIFPPLMVYFCLLMLVFVACLIAYMKRHPTPPSHAATPPGVAAVAISIVAFVLSGFAWPFYYLFSPRMQRVFTR